LRHGNKAHAAYGRRATFPNCKGPPRPALAWNHRS
jgi:hypothetical protein